MQHGKKEKKKKKDRIKGSTVIICFMYATWIAYLALQIWMYLTAETFLPSEVTMGTAALFIVETVSLARLKMAKEGAIIPEKKTNPFLEQLGLSFTSEFEEDVEELNKQKEEENADNHSEAI